MIIEFKPVDLNTFEGRFNGKLLQIVRLGNGNWKLYIDYMSGSNMVKSSARACMEMADDAAHKVVNKLRKGTN